MIHVRRALSILVSLGFAVTASSPSGCSKPAEPDPGPPQIAPATSSGPSAAPGPATQTPAAVPGTRPAEITWTAPASWKSAPNPSPMRKATYKIAKADDDPEDAELSVSQAGGGVDANIKRWSSQFDGLPELKVTHRDVGSLAVTIVEGHGTFNGGGMPGGPPAAPKKGWALLAAIVESAEPPYFFKLTGPEKTVKAAKGDFDTFVGSFKGK